MPHWGAGCGNSICSFFSADQRCAMTPCGLARRDYKYHVDRPSPSPRSPVLCAELQMSLILVSHTPTNHAVSFPGESVTPGVLSGLWLALRRCDMQLAHYFQALRVSSTTLSLCAYPPTVVHVSRSWVLGRELSCSVVSNVASPPPPSGTWEVSKSAAPLVERKNPRYWLNLVVTLES